MLAGMALAILAYQPIFHVIYSTAGEAVKVAEAAPAKVTFARDLVKGTTDSVITTTSIKTTTDGAQFKVTEKTTIYADASKPAKVDKPAITDIKLGSRDYWKLVALVAVMILFVTMVYGPIAAFLVELFPTRIRYTSMSLPYHIGNGVFGGLVPFLGTLIVEMSKSPELPAGDPYAGLWYPIGVASLCFVIGALYLSNKVDADVTD